MARALWSGDEFLPELHPRLAIFNRKHSPEQKSIRNRQTRSG